MQIAEIGKQVKMLKTLILRSRYMAARQANAGMLRLYFAIGAYNLGSFLSVGFSHHKTA